MRSLLKWWFASLASRRALAASATMIALFATTLLSLGWVLLHDVVPSLDGRFGSAQGYQSPVSLGLAPADVPSVCTGQVRIGEYNTEAMWVAPGPITAPMITDATLPAVGSAVLSPTLSTRSGLGIGDTFQIAQRSYVVAGIGQNPDGVKQALVVLPISDADPASSCKVLTDTEIDASWAKGAIFWSRGDQDPIVLYQLVVGTLFALVAISAATLIAGAFRTFAETMRPEIAALLAIGVSKRQLTKVVAGAAGLMGIVIGAASVVIALVVRAMAGPAAARAMGIEPRGGHVSIGLIVVVIAAATICLLFGMVRPVRQVARSSLTVELTGTVSAAVKWRRSAVGWTLLLLVGVVVWLASDAPAASVASVVVVSLAGLGLAPTLLRLLGLMPGIPQPYGLLYRSKTLAGARRLAPLVRIGAASMGLGLVLLLSTSAVAAGRTEHPDVRPNEMVVTSQTLWGEATFPGDAVHPTGAVPTHDIDVLRQRLGADVIVEPLTTVIFGEEPASSFTQAQWEYDVHGKEVGKREFSAKFLPLYVTPTSLNELAVDEKASSSVRVFVPADAANGSLPLPDDLEITVTPVPAPWSDARAAPAVTVSRDDAARLGRLVDVGVLVTALHRSLSSDETAAVHDFADQRGLLVAAPPRSPVVLVSAVTVTACVLAVLIGLAVGLLYRAVSRPESRVFRLLGVDTPQRQRVDGLALAAAAVAGLGGALVVAGGAVMALIDSGVPLRWPFATTCLLFVAGLSSLLTGLSRQGATSG